MDEAQPNSFDRAQWFSAVIQVDAGLMTIEEAESSMRGPTEALGPSMGPLVRALEFESSQWLEEANWPIALAIAWAMRRNDEEAAAIWARYRRWGPLLWRVEPEDWRRAEAEVFHQLRAGSLNASARRLSEEARIEIPPAEWTELTLTRAGSADIISMGRNRCPCYVGLLIGAADARRIWPRITAALAKTKTKAALKAQCEKELIGIMLRDLHRPTPKTALRGQFAGLSKRGFDDAFSAAVTKANAWAWRAPGRRKSLRS